MRNSKIKVYLFILSLMLLSSKAMAVRAPLDAQGHALQTISWNGAFPCTINGANQSITTSAPIVCTQGSTLTATPSVVYGVIASSIQTSAYLVFRDTIPAINNSPSSLTVSTAAIIYGYNVFTSTSSQTVGTGIYIFPVPIQFKNGISVNVDSAFSGPVSDWTILYRPIDSTTVGN